jgi:hypothetical protein
LVEVAQQDTRADVKGSIERVLAKKEAKTLPRADAKTIKSWLDTWPVDDDLESEKNADVVRLSLFKWPSSLYNEF